MSSQTIVPTPHGPVVIKYNQYDFLIDAMAVNLTLTPPDLFGWGVSQSIPINKIDTDVDQLNGELTLEFIGKWADNAIGKLRS
ncbi:hypothetical protein HPQ32_14015 [Photobacterium carnosum]|uniref:hypothetical protein n=1 Tax=Photobacterium carnosum TaxID=2023717 RepID=UPI001C91F4A0|nr:hypothetical protein [Photobacterium carnosum]MBY3789539.1 hypothetical protein [Photobacterium carnosum]MCD9534598.1 hypothetical protein [Photobacterium carnosum]